jgi:hypothetical protein
MYFNIQLPAMFAFLVFCKSGITKSCFSIEDLSVYKISWSRVDWCKFCIHFKSLNTRHFGMVTATALKITVVQMLIVGTNRQDGDLTILHVSFRKESRLKKEIKLILCYTTLDIQMS